VFDVVAAFTENTVCHVFGLGLSAHYYLWDSWSIAIKPQDNQKQLQAAFYVELQIVFIDTVNRGAEEEEQKQSSEQCTVESNSLNSPSASAVSLIFLFPFSFFFVFCILHCSPYMWTVESSSPPASVISTVSHYSSPSPSPSPSSSAFSTVHVTWEQWPKKPIRILKKPNDLVLVL